MKYLYLFLSALIITCFSIMLIAILPFTIFLAVITSPLIMAICYWEDGNIESWIDFFKEASIFPIFVIIDLWKGEF